MNGNARYMAEDILLEYNKTWLSIIHPFLVVYTNCSRESRERGANSLQLILRSLEGHGIINEKKEAPFTRPEPHKTGPKLESDRSTERYSIFDMQKILQAMASIFPESYCPDGAKTRTFFSEAQIYTSPGERLQNSVSVQISSSVFLVTPQSPRSSLKDNSSQILTKRTCEVY